MIGVKRRDANQGSRRRETYPVVVSEHLPLRVMTGDEFNDLLRDAPPPTADDVSITVDGERLDTKEKVLAFCERLAADRAQAS